jgi:UDP-N-acetylglucosamine 2-epimerase (non-hydrolysing)
LSSDGALTSIRPGEISHVVLVGTKPDIIKQAPVFHELAGRGHRVLVCHTGQHFDHNLSGAMLEEFGISQLANLEVKGRPEEVVSGITARFAAFLRSVEEKSAGAPVISYVHGDTTTAMAGALGAFSVGQPVVHVEAGLRTLSPTKEILLEWIAGLRANELDWATYQEQSMSLATYERGSREPSPEQFNTRVADSAAQLHAAPVALNESFLLSDGYSPRSIAVVGNSVVDALEQSPYQEVAGSTLSRYPSITDGEFIRFCVHRKENTSDRSRFTALMGAIGILLEKGHSILFIRLPGTDQAIRRFGLGGWLDDCQSRFGQRFITTPVWDRYSDVLEAMRNCAVVATDSGSIQEEVNVLNVPCVTLRFGSDRGESLLAGGNFLAPPVDPTCIAGAVDAVFHNRKQVSLSRVYPSGAAGMLVDEVEARLASGGLLSTEEWRYGL